MVLSMVDIYDANLEAAQIAEHALPGELIPTSTTVEYELPQPRTLLPPVPCKPRGTPIQLPAALFIR